jgi:hypothetical protein
MTAQAMTRFAAAVQGASSDRVVVNAFDAWSEFTGEAYSGIGDLVVPLPRGAHDGVVTAIHAGRSNFVVEVLDRSGRPCGLLVNRIGRYRGTTAFGLGAGLRDAVQLRVIADGGWIMHVGSISSAPTLELPSAGVGDGVLRVEGARPELQFSHGGQGNVIVVQSAPSGSTRLTVNEIGPFEGAVAIDPGPAVLAVRADGPWKITTR